MIRSLRTGVSGLKSHQTRMDVTGNNIANVNTIGFKKSRTAFSEVLGERLLGTSRSSGGSAVNTSFVGFGVSIASIDRSWTQGALENTNFKTDLALNGDGFFVVNNGERDMLTRAGKFEFDVNGNLVNAAGMQVRGYSVDASGNVDRSGLADVALNWSSQSDAKYTTEAVVGGNLSADAAIGDTESVSQTIYDEQGSAHSVVMTFEKTADNAWDYTVSYGGTETTPPFADATGTLTFDVDGQLTASTPVAVTWDSGYTTGSTTFDMNIENLTQFAGNSTALIREQDGYQSGKLIGYGVDPSGMLSLNYSNGESIQVFQVAAATVNNANGLESLGEGLLGTTAASGDMVLGRAGNEVNAAIVAGALEMSNVDLANEFTDMIVSQRGYQASARVITTSDEILQETVNLKR